MTRKAYFIAFSGTRNTVLESLLCLGQLIAKSPELLLPNTNLLRCSLQGMQSDRFRRQWDEAERSSAVFPRPVALAVFMAAVLSSDVASRHARQSAR